MMDWVGRRDMLSRASPLGAARCPRAPMSLHGGGPAMFVAMGVSSVQGDFQFWKSYEASVDHMLAQDEASLRWVLGPGPVPADLARSSL